MSRPSGTSRSARHASIQRRLSLVHKRLIEETRRLTGADSDLMKKAAGVLQKAIKKRASTVAGNLRTAVKPNAKGKRRMYGTPSAPGESPRKITGALARGVKSRVQDGVRVVVAENFKSKIHEFGYVAPAVASRPQKYQVFGKARKHQGMTKARAARSQAPRPFLRPGLEDAKPELAKVGASVMTDGIRAALANGGAGG